MTESFGVSDRPASSVTRVQAATSARPSPIRGPAGGVRSFERRDLDAVVRLFLARFNDGRIRVGPDGINRSFADYFERLYFGSPAYDPEGGSLVHVNTHGDIDGFVGSIQCRFELQGTVLRAAIGNAFMVADHPSATIAAQRLLRTFQRSPGNDVICTDTANRRSMPFLNALKWRMLPQNGLDWLQVLQPARFAVFGAHRKWNRLPRSLLDPCARLADGVARRLIPGRAPTKVAHPTETVEIDQARFIALAPEFLKGLALRPRWDEAELGWLVAQAAAREKAGPLRFHEVRNADGQVIGCHACYVRPGGVAMALQLLSERRHVAQVLDSLLDFAAGCDAIAVRGATDPRLLPALYARPGILFHHVGAVMIRARDPDLLAAVAEDDMLIGGFVGDRWTRLASDRFD